MEKKDQLQEWAWLFLWGVTLISLFGSLFYSEVLGYAPCELCWIQRILMYPLVVIYGVAALLKNIAIALPGLILSSIGLCVSVYHYFVQKYPNIISAGEMCTDIPCNLQYVNYLGFITIPFLAGTAFLFIIVCHLFLMKRTRRSTDA